MVTLACARRPCNVGHWSWLGHFCDATCSSVVTHDKAGRSMLYHLQFPDVISFVWILDITGILFYRTDKCLVTQLLGLSWKLTNVPWEESSCHSHRVNVIVPAQ